MKSLKSYLTISSLILVSSHFVFAGPACDQLSFLQREYFVCQDHNRDEDRRIDYLRQETQSKWDDINQSQNYLKSCQSDLVAMQENLKIEQTQLSALDQETDKAQARLQEDQNQLDQDTKSFECVGMEQKYAQSFRTFGRTLEEARARLANPDTSGMSAAEYAQLKSYLDMAKKHGVYIFCERNFVSANPGQTVIGN